MTVNSWMSCNISSRIVLLIVRLLKGVLISNIAVEVVVVIVLMLRLLSSSSSTRLLLIHQFSSFVAAAIIFLIALNFSIWRHVVASSSDPPLAYSTSTSSCS